MQDLADKLIKLNSLIKALLSPKQPLMVPALKMPTLNKVPNKEPEKIPGIAPNSKKNPVKVAQQLKNPRPTKPKIEVLKTDKNGQWKLEEN